MPSPPSVMTTFSAREASRRFNARTGRPEAVSRIASRASRSVGVISVMPLKRAISAICDEACRSADIDDPVHFDPGLLQRFPGIGSRRVLAEYRKQARLGAETARMRGNDP